MASPPEPSSSDATRTDWRALGQLRDRVELAAREIERLRSENAALAQRLVELENRPEAAGVVLGESDPDVLKGRIQGFIDTIDDILRTASDDPASDAA